MPRINEHYLKLAGAYLFPEINRRVEAFVARHPSARNTLINCGIGDVTEPLPDAAVQAMHRAVDDLGGRDTFKGYGPGVGYSFLRESIAHSFFQSRGIAIGAEEVFVSDGSKGDCGHILEILGPGNRIAITDPVYPVYVDTNVMHGNTGHARDGGYEGILYMPMTPANDFVPDVPKEAVDLIYLCYPNNPTGAMIDRSRLTEWVNFALAHDAIILYDVAYRAFISDDVLPKSIYEIDGATRCAMELHSFSKSGGFTGVRCGFTVCPKKLKGSTALGENVALHELWTRRWSTRSNGVSYIVQRGAEALFSDQGTAQVKELSRHYLSNASILRQGCEQLGLNVYGGKHSPYVWVTCPDGMTSWQMFDQLLADVHIVTTPGSGFGAHGEGFFRISAFNTRDNVQNVVKRLASLTVSTE